MNHNETIAILPRIFKVFANFEGSFKIRDNFME